MSIENDHWVPSISDPTIIGWVTVAVYFIVAIICLKATFISKLDKNQNKSNQEKSIKNFLLFLTFFLIALGINKQLDLQTLLTQIGKNIAIEQGWYKDRRLVQVGFIIFIGLVGVSSLIILIRIYRNTCSSVKIALTGCIILFSFILIRASSFHHMDIFINIKIIATRINSIFELGSLLIIGLGGFRYFYSKNLSVS